VLLCSNNYAFSKVYFIRTRRSCLLRAVIRTTQTSNIVLQICHAIRNELFKLFVHHCNVRIVKYAEFM